MMQFTGQKFFAIEGDTTTVYDIYGNKTEKQNFRMTRKYLAYLKEKAEHEAKMEVIKLREKLEYEFKTYGEVDNIDYQRFLQLVAERG